MRQNVPIKLHALEPFGNLVAFLNEVLEVFVSQFVASLKASVVRAGLLNGVISKMHKFVFELVIRYAVFLRARANVTFFVKVTPSDTICAYEHCVYPDVKLPSVDEQWSVDVALHYQSVLLLWPETSGILLMVAGIDLSTVRLTKCDHFVELRLGQQIFAGSIDCFLLGKFNEITDP